MFVHFFLIVSNTLVTDNSYKTVVSSTFCDMSLFPWSSEVAQVMSLGGEVSINSRTTASFIIFNFEIIYISSERLVHA